MNFTDTPVNIVSFPLDHIYAITAAAATTTSASSNNNTAGSSDLNELQRLQNLLAKIREENKKLKELSIAHLDLIQQQSDQINDKDKQLALYREENDKLKTRLSLLPRSTVQTARNPPPLIHIPTSTQQPTTGLAVQPGNSAVPKLGDFPDHRITTSAPGSKTSLIFIRKPTIQQEVMTISPREEVKTARGNTCRRSEDGPETFRKNLNSQPITYSKRTNSTSNTPETSQIIRLPETSKNDLTKNTNTFSTGKCKMIYSYNIKQGPDNKLDIKETKTIAAEPFEFCNQTNLLFDHLTDSSSVDDQSITLHQASSQEIAPSQTIQIEEIQPETSSLTADVTCTKKSTIQKSTDNKIKKVVKPKRIKKDYLRTNDRFQIWMFNKKIETSCRDFSYGETINNLSTNVVLSPVEELRSVYEENLAACPFRGLPDDTYDRLFYKAHISEEKSENSSSVSQVVSEIVPEAVPEAVSEVVPEAVPEVIPEEISVEISEQNPPKDNKVVKPKKKPIKRFTKRKSSAESQETPQESESNLLVSNVFAAEDSRDTLYPEKRTRVPSLYGDDSIPDAFWETGAGDSNKVVKKQTALKSTSKRSRIRTFSMCSRSSTTSQSDVQSTVSRPFSATRFKTTMDNQPLRMLTTSEHYYTNMMNPVQNAAPSDNSALIEVPRWRILDETAGPSREESSECEDLDDAVFEKRHRKMENAEKRIKRRYLQQLKEEEHLKKLKERQEKSSFPSRKKDPPPRSKPSPQITTLWPSAEDVQFIQVQETIPVTAFGEFIPDFGKRAFGLPWLHQNDPKRSSRTKSRRRSE